VDRYGAHAFAQILRNSSLKREISKPGAVQRYRIPDKQRPSRAVADSSKGLASRFYQLKTGALPHRATPPVVDEEPDLRERRTVGGARTRCISDTQEHPFKNRPRWKPQQKALWAEVRRETGSASSYGTCSWMSGAPGRSSTSFVPPDVRRRMEPDGTREEA
jgi:hypothetical protein